MMKQYPIPYTQPVGLPRQQGFTLVELMVAITLSMIMLAALSQAFVFNSRDANQMDNVSRQVENGRYAMRVLSDSLQHAGFLGEFSVDVALNAGNPLTMPQAKPNPCVIAFNSDPAVANNDVLNKAMLIPIQAYNTAAQAPACINDVKPSSDVIVVRHVSTCVRGSLDCDDGTNAPFFQASRCDDPELNNPDVRSHYRLDTVIANLNRTDRTCNAANLAPMRRFHVHIYYIANNDQPGDGIPTLKRAMLDNGGFTVQSIANGIEEMEFEYGIDTNQDNIIDAYTAVPDTFNGCGGPNAPCSPRNWYNVLAVRIHLLARTPETTAGYQDKKRYTVGLSSDDATLIQVGPYNDGFKRHVYEGLVMLMNPSMRQRMP